MRIDPVGLPAGFSRIYERKKARFCKIERSNHGNWPAALASTFHPVFLCSAGFSLNHENLRGFDLMNFALKFESRVERVSRATR
jgi:hypothetical protein